MPRGRAEAIIAARAIQDEVVPPTVNYDRPVPKCDLDYVPNLKKEMEVN